MTGNDASASRASAWLTAFEKEHDPFRYLVRGASIWTALRFPTWERLKIALGDLSPRDAPAMPGGRRASLAATVGEWRAQRALSRGGSRFDVVATSSSGRLRDPDGARWRNAYYDYVSEGLPSTLYFYIDSRQGREPYNVSSVFVSAAAHRLAMARLRRSRFEGLDAARELHARVAGSLATELPGVPTPLSLAEMEHEAVRFATRYDAFARVLRGCGAKLLLSDCYYDRTWAVAAAHSLDIPVYELQHGIVYGSHVAYRFERESVAVHRRILPIPDRILSFGPWFSEVFRQGQAWEGSEVVDVGFPRMEHQRRHFAWRHPEPGAPLRLLISSQWILTDRLEAFVGELLPLLPDGVEVVVKRHPLERDDAFSRLPGARVAREGDFYEALADCHVHASVFSTTLVESVGLGVPTVVIGLDGAESANGLIEEGAARRVATPEALAVLLAAIAAEPSSLDAWHAATEAAAARFWTPGAAANVRRLLVEAVSRPPAAG